MTPLITPEQALGIGFVFTRVIGIFLSFPLLNTSMIPLNIRVLFLVSLSFYISSILDIKISVEDLIVVEILLNILKELLVGFLLGIIVTIFISAFSYAAELISYFMGLTIVNTFDPTFGQIAVLDRLFILIFYLLFFITGVYQIFLAGVVASFEIFPVYAFSLNTGVFQYILEKSTQIFVLGFKLAFPFILVLFITNVVLALINRLIPQIMVFIVGLPLQIFLGLISLAIGTATIIYFAVNILDQTGSSFVQIIKHIGK
ncbi:MAG: flagellar biosynthetic protein FliR [Aquificae bacterium]|nr:flagellar biosynthetic protein FliR [Aquificota bacterium]